MPLEELLAAAMSGRMRNDEPGLSKVGQVRRLQEFLTRYQAPNPFKVGDLVTPRTDANMKAAGEPHVVVDLRDVPIFSASDDSSSCQYGRHLNVRTARFTTTGIVCFWGEHFDYEPYTGDCSRPGDVPA